MDIVRHPFGNEANNERRALGHNAQHGIGRGHDVAGRVKHAGNSAGMAGAHDIVLLSLRQRGDEIAHRFGRAGLPRGLQLLLRQFVIALRRANRFGLKLQISFERDLFGAIGRNAARVGHRAADGHINALELFAQGIHVLVLELNAWTAYAAGQPASGIALMREAAELEASTPKHAVTPGPTLPAHELLGDLYLDMGRPADALSAYRRAMELYPRRFNSLLGAALAARALGDAT